MPSESSEGAILRCPYCLRRRDHNNAMMSWCLGKCEDDPDVERQATGFVEADELIHSGGGEVAWP